jgi:dihydroneopterin aldolase
MQQTPSTVSIALKRAELRVRIGEHPHEQDPQRPSRLHVDVTLTFDYHDYFEQHGGYVNYDPLRTFLQELQTQPHINRLEDFSRSILAACFAKTPAARVKLSVMKPDIFPEMDGVGIEIDVARADFTR